MFHQKPDNPILSISTLTIPRILLVYPRHIWICRCRYNIFVTEHSRFIIKKHASTENLVRILEDLVAVFYKASPCYSDSPPMSAPSSLVILSVALVALSCFWRSQLLPVDFSHSRSLSVAPIASDAPNHSQSVFAAISCSWRLQSL